MASEPVGRPADYAQLHKAPDHIVDMVLGLMCSSVTSPVMSEIEAARRARVEARVWADRIWAEATHAGAMWGLSRAPVKIELDLGAMPLLGDLIRENAPALSEEAP